MTKANNNPPTIELTRGEARRIAVIAQGLHSKAPFGRGMKGLIRSVGHIGYVQIDTISVVARAHNHVLFSRIPQFKPSNLSVAQKKKRQILEYWAHAAAYIPMDHYRFTIPIQDHFRSGSDGWPRSDRQLMNRVVDRIRSEGPLMSRDFDPQVSTPGTWWDWKPAKRALHRLFLEGELVISHREGFQRVFDLPERVIPTDTPTQPPSETEYSDFLIDQYLKSHGFGSSKMIAYLRRGMRAKIDQRIAQRLQDGSLVPFSIKDVKHTLLVAHPNIETILSTSVKQRARVLSPFDNLVIQRERLKLVFDFDYQIECYVPREKRVFGYFVLPVLYGSKIIGRIDAKAERKTREFKVLSYAVEKGIDFDEFKERLHLELLNYANFCGCDFVTWHHSSSTPS